ncbi:hypothetical protein BSK59_29330 [Paenibacillus odorifer]|nr:hypothetical protein BSK59_29330 [Paenibacillus odorifer]
MPIAPKRSLETISFSGRMRGIPVILPLFISQKACRLSITRPTVIRKKMVEIYANLVHKHQTVLQ